jgi:hypothetical protein
MLFIPEEECGRVWKNVCHAVSENRLGVAAKIAIKSSGGDDSARLICIYTKDFDDKSDLQRVLLELQKMGLLPQDTRRSIYYKCDAYTHLEIMSGNEYGLQASLYSSKEILKESTPAKSFDRNQPTIT